MQIQIVIGLVCNAHASDLLVRGRLADIISRKDSNEFYAYFYNKKTSQSVDSIRVVNTFDVSVAYYEWQRMKRTHLMNWNRINNRVLLSLNPEQKQIIEHRYLLMMPDTIVMKTNKNTDMIKAKTSIEKMTDVNGIFTISKEEIGILNDMIYNECKDIIRGVVNDTSIFVIKNIKKLFAMYPDCENSVVKYSIIDTVRIDDVRSLKFKFMRGNDEYQLYTNSKNEILIDTIYGPIE